MGVAEMIWWSWGVGFAVGFVCTVLTEPVAQAKRLLKEALFSVSRSR